jgi:hypothetical protein
MPAPSLLFSSDGSDDSIFVFERSSDIEESAGDGYRSSSPPSEVHADDRGEEREKEQDQDQEVHDRKFEVSATVGQTYFTLTVIY